ncbi:putative Glyoxylate/hydroxypyruvate reductase A [Blattamonas nauphoetae]|uniref:Glyoxylate/hydroxypyruvate reductase A n=1 Tax=Blattamonas nauphoetae TaxID=2049346 RepID=A0ABQ9WTA5_9EUKA|nr:putative Glyoxylate/hydroxypyruvate reductase A [Blattamonas nauphoetae]
MADYIIGTTISTHRHIYQLKQIQSTGASPFGIVEQASAFPLVSQLRVGILGGTGSIGQDIARRFYGIGATVVGAGRKERKEGEEWLQRQVESEWDKRLPKASDSFSSFVSLEGDDAQRQNKLRAFLKDLDVIVNVLPSTPETHYLLGGRQIDGTDGVTEPLSVCKPSSILVNVGRGTAISEAAVCSALNKGFIRHAILDVFEEEPLPPTSALLKLNPSLVTLTPHVSGIPQSADFMESLLNFNILNFVRGMEKDAEGGMWG